MEKDNTDIDWADVVDLLASEYGWTNEYIAHNLDLGQVVALRNTIKKRYDKQNGQISSEDETVPSVEESFNVSDFEKLGKKNVREDGTVEIII